MLSTCDVLAWKPHKPISQYCSKQLAVQPDLLVLQTTADNHNMMMTVLEVVVALDQSLIT